METIRVRTVDAFTDEPFAGNPAGVVCDADGLTGDQQQAIASELAVSETAFLTASPRADYRIRYFTPTQEVPLCGHATVAAVAHLHESGALEGERLTLETDVGVLETRVDDDGTVWMDQDAPSVRPADLAYSRLADALGVEQGALESVGQDLPLAVASTGLPALVVPITYLSELGDATPSAAAVEALCAEVDATGLYLFTFDTLAADATLHGRFFAPGAGVPEDPVTGTASGAVCAYLERYGAFDTPPEEFRLEQGHFLERPGQVRVRLAGGVSVGGTAVTTLEGTLVVPDADEEDIIEV
ncbi:PhzF family phenazine biosynthesis protein [Natronobiforma cellulositropha]|uniref:PhzF family phenazine biosynthesis protein n=1 Tax=Natronobiforma cellulositropha TaxID=1679076 RepID=UPI0021D5BA07|nr:PhzF family phenazine biosynthesis protein [Natronobiforma cellulositropha]